MAFVTALAIGITGNNHIFILLFAFVVSSGRLTHYQFGKHLFGNDPFLWYICYRKYGKEKAAPAYRKICLNLATIELIIGSIGFIIAIATELVFYIIGIK